MEKFHVFIQLYLLLYADDTVLMSESESGLQHAIDVFHSYCNTWKLELNTLKTKIIVFCKKKYKKNFYFTYDGVDLEIVDIFPYLGVTFKYNGNFSDAKKILVTQAQKAMYALYGKVNYLNLSVNVQLELFDSLVTPILLYSSEIWGYENTSLIENMHIQFCKRLLKVRKSTPNFMVYGELGRFPLYIQIFTRMFNFWCKLVQTQSTLSSCIYSVLYNLHESGSIKSLWVQHIKKSLNSTGLTFLWHMQHSVDLCKYKTLFQSILQDMFIQEWFSNQVSSKGSFYFSFKNSFKLEDYLLKLNYRHAITICKLRTSNHKFPIETGRWCNVIREDRLCPLCMEAVGDEFHYLFICKHFETERYKYIPRYFLQNPSVHKMCTMLSQCNIKLLSNVSIFLSHIYKIFS